MKTMPSIDEWVNNAKADIRSGKIGMYLVHNGIVRSVPKAVVRDNVSITKSVIGMSLSIDEELVEKYLYDTKNMPGIYYVNLWLNEGKLHVGDDIMLVLIGGDIRPHVVDALNYLVGNLKDYCLKETELF